jgi:hypothetical protein
MDAVKIIWVQRPNKELKAVAELEVDQHGYTRGLRDADMDAVQHWIWNNLPSANRRSFDTWRFASEQDMAVFLLRWS